MRILVIGVVVVAILAGALFFFFGQSLFKAKPAEKKAVSLNVWGLWEDEKLMKGAIDEYKKTHPDVTINYKYQSSQNYRSRVQTQIKEGQGPDIFMLGNSWLPMFLNAGQLAPAPEDIYTMDQFTKDFYPVIKEDFTKNGKIYGVPRGIDGLGLYYNEDILKAANINPPVTWNEFKDAALKATVSDQDGVIKTAGAAMGLTGNVDHFSDIIGLLFMQQPGAKIDQPNDKAGAEVLQFYTDFVRDEKGKTWDSTMESSTQAFAAGKLAFYFAPSWRAHELRQANPQLNFKIVSVPQLGNSRVGWANYWGYGVSARSQNQKEAWEFLKFMVSSDTEKLLYQEAAKVRLFGLPYSRVDLQKEIVNDPLVGAFVAQGPVYKSWYLNSNTKDQALNDEMIKYYEDAVNKVAAGGDSRSALDTAQKGIKQLLNTYVNPAPQASK